MPQNIAGKEEPESIEVDLEGKRVGGKSDL
jgi:hypothetical protein